MPEKGSRRAASYDTAQENLGDMYLRETKDMPRVGEAMSITDKLRAELKAKGLKGFKRGGKVKKTGVYKLHKGEKVLTRTQAEKKGLQKKVALSASKRLKGKRI